MDQNSVTTDALSKREGSICQSLCEESCSRNKAGSRPSLLMGKAEDTEEEAGICILWDPPGYFATFALAPQNDAYAHIFLIVPISVALILSDKRSRIVLPEPNVFAGSVLCDSCRSDELIGRGRGGTGDLPADAQLSMGMLAVVTCGRGVRRLFRYLGNSQVCFSSCFSLWLVLVPVVALNRIVRSCSRVLRPLPIYSSR